MRILLFIAFFFCSASIQAQNFLSANEVNIFSFKTKAGKQVVIAKDTANAYIVYRYGSANKIEFEFPSNRKTSWTNFKYAFYLRGGGLANEAMDLDYLYFDNNSFRYVVYNTYFARGNTVKTGIKIIDLKTNKTTNINGINKTRKGSLSDFRSNNLLEITDEIFD
ncbi:hypothetical protein [Ferruginibacter sp. SUN106]|uniref:hypothetical protein n=1 Tax=Ferruginibacter sp. SUN106 TaxID=2978348 RepID=UPI003D35FE20